MKLHLPKRLRSVLLACLATLFVGLPTTLGTAFGTDAVYFDVEQHLEDEYGTLVIALDLVTDECLEDSQYSGREQVYVPCAVNWGGSVARIAEVGCGSYVGETVLAAHIVTGALICADDARVYDEHAYGHGLTYARMDVHYSKESCYSIQCVNVYHSRLKQLIRQFRSISTKHLSNCLMMLNFAIFARETLKCAKRYQHAME